MLALVLTEICIVRSERWQVLGVVDGGVVVLVGRMGMERWRGTGQVMGYGDCRF